MGFSQLCSEAGLQQLNSFLADKAFVEGWQASQPDVAVFEAVGCKRPNAVTFPHAARWYDHISSFDATTRATWPGEKKSVDHYGPKGTAAAVSAPAADDDIDLFGDDDDDAEAEKAKQARIDEMKAKKAGKPEVIAKSSILFDVKPWDDQTDLKEMEASVRSIEMDGLLWGAAKLVPVGYGIKKLTINAVIEDAKVSTDELEERITAFEELVQSIDIAAFNKI